MSVNRFNFTLIFIKAALHANRSGEKKWPVSISYISGHIFQKFPNTSAHKNVYFGQKNHDIHLCLSQVALHGSNLDL